MKQARELFSENDKNKIAEAVREAELKTSGEIVPVVANESGRYDRAEDIVGIITAVLLIGLLYCGYAMTTGDGWQGAGKIRPGYLATSITLLAGFVGGSICASVFPSLRRVFIPADEMQREVEKSAREAFHNHRIRSTEGSTGLLVYVSLFERMVRVIGDSAISEKLSQSDWQEVCDKVTHGLKDQRPTNGFIEGIESAGALLAKHFPVEAGDINELTNELVIID